MFVLDAERRVVFANTVAEELFGTGFVGNDFVQVIRHPDCMRLIGDALSGFATTSRTISIEYPVKAQFQVQAKSIGNMAADDKSVLVSLKDISDQQDVEKMRTDFVANVSHELRSPLTALSGFIETLQGPANDDKAATQRFLGLMNHEASRMVRLIADLLSLSKFEADARMRPTGHADVEAILRRIMTTLEAVAEKEGKSIQLEVDTAHTKVLGSDEELTQVFQNLVENAIKYSAPDTPVTIKTDVRDKVAGIPGAALAVEVRDTGDGIAPEHIARLTERFYRVDTHRSRDKGGTGLGLAIVKHIINRHRGRMNIVSEVGKGSAFIVYLPLVTSGK